MDSDGKFLTLRFEGITATIKDEFITVRVSALYEGRTINCGMTIMFHHVFAAIALRPLEGDLIRCEATMTEGTVEEYLESLLGTAATAA